MSARRLTQLREELNLGTLNTNPSSGREEDLNLGPPDYKPIPLGHVPARPWLYMCK